MLCSICSRCAVRCSVGMLTKATLFVICALVLCSILLASVKSVLHIDYEHYGTHGGDEPARQRVRRLREQYGRVEDSPANIVWFLQISDIHISIFRDHSRITQFQQFCDHTVKRIAPHVVLATGDLTDAKAKDNMGSSQVKMEWIYYHNIIKESGVTDETVWLDIRGNHDNFNVESLNSNNNYFKNYSVQGPKNARSYVYRNNVNGVDVAFLGVDACPEPGLRRPFNFIGMLNTNEVRLIQNLQNEVANKANHTIWFGHYPTSCIIWTDDQTDGNIRDLIGSTDSSTAYLCGHLHSMGGLVPNMYTMHRSQFLELELSDWKDNRVYRLGVIDHGLFSFVDQKHNEWPLVLVTNPKHARYTLPDREPLDLMLTSTHIRILAFSDSEIEEVTVSVERGTWRRCNNVKGPLYACTWNPEDYLSGIRQMKVVVKDSGGKEKEIDHPFSLDHTRLQYDFISRILLMVSASAVFQSLFATFLTISVLPLVAMRLLNKPPSNRKCCSRLLRRLWILSKVDKLFYPLVLYAVYLPFGPWSVGELIDGQIGAIFAWGIIIGSSFLPGSFTYMYGSIQLFFVHIPLTLVIASSVERRLSAQRAKGIKKVTTHLPFILLLTVQMLFAYFFWLAYGTIAFLFGPLRTWSIFLSTILWYKSLTLPPEYCRKLEKMLSPGA